MKRFPPPSHRPIPTRDKKQRREPTSVGKGEKKRLKDAEEDKAREEKALMARARRENLVAINWDKIEGWRWGGPNVKTLAGKYYLDMSFRCMDCGKDQIWTGRQQQWWYEVAKGSQEQTAIRCRDCRIKRRAQSAASRKVHLEGLDKKRLARAGVDYLKKRKRRRPGNA